MHVQVNTQRTSVKDGNWTAKELSKNSVASQFWGKRDLEEALVNDVAFLLGQCPLSLTRETIDNKNSSTGDSEITIIRNLKYNFKKKEKMMENLKIDLKSLIKELYK